MRIIACLALMFLMSLTAAAQLEGNPDNWCREGFFTRETKDFRLAKVTGTDSERAYFFHDLKDDCPAGSDCRAKTYVVPGDEVVVSRQLGNFSCAWYTGAKGTPTVGWIENSKLAAVEVDHSPAVRSWLGEWRAYGNVISITNNKLAGWVNVTGDAVWKGLGDNVHIGELDYRAEPRGNSMYAGEPEPGEYDCQVNMKLIGKYLVVADNMHCGGANVTFSGVYTKRR